MVFNKNNTLGCNNAKRILVITSLRLRQLQYSISRSHESYHTIEYKTIHERNRYFYNSSRFSLQMMEQTDLGNQTQLTKSCMPMTGQLFAQSMDVQSACVVAATLKSL